MRALWRQRYIPSSHAVAHDMAVDLHNKECIYLDWLWTATHSESVETLSRNIFQLSFCRRA
jgi:hypothetical protein